MYQPCVVETGGEYPYKMWFFGWAAAATNPGWPGCDAIFLARSQDLKSWEVYSVTSKPFDERAGYPATMMQCIMGAVSEDGMH